MRAATWDSVPTVGVPPNVRREPRRRPWGGRKKIIVDAEQFARAMESVDVLNDDSEDLRLTCAERGASNSPESAGPLAAVATGGHASPNKSKAEPPSDGTARPQPAAKRRTKQQPLYMRMFTDKHVTALVRAVGYAGFPATEGPQRMKPLIDEFGEPLMRAAVDEIVEVDPTQDPPVARLTAQARQLAVGLLGRPKEASATTAAVPPPTPVPEPAAAVEASSTEATDEATSQSVPAPRRRKSKRSPDS